MTPVFANLPRCWLSRRESFLFSRSESRRRGKPGRRRRGIAVVLVLALVAITLAVSYATLRGQGITSEVARNGGRALDAQEAARSGLAAALRKMSENGWAGIDVPISGNITANSGYQVTFTAGDTKLLSTDASYNEWPFRVMIDSYGYASDPLNPAIQSQHHSRCVVQLLRKKLLAEPSNWASLNNYNVYQYSNQNTYVQFPVRINGNTFLNGTLKLATEYPNNTAALNQYLGDLNLRRLAGLGDYRPFPTTVTISLSRQDAATTTQLTTKLGMILTDTAASTSAPLSHPGTVLKYKLYPGGPSFDVPLIQGVYGNPLQNATLAPNPKTNPLGIYRSNSTLNIQGNVSITGTIISDSSNPDIQVYGTNVVWQPYTLPSLYGSGQSYQLPAALVYDLRMNPGSSAQIKGTTLVWHEFEIKSSSTATNFNLTGRLITDTLLLRGRTTWTQTAATWLMDNTSFSTQKLLPGGILYFPDYQENKKSFVVKPTLTFTPDSSGVQPHWHDWTQPFYQPDPADPGLCWEVVRWEDNL